MDTPDTSHTVDLRPPSLWRDVRAGVAGLPPRVALSLASGAALAAIVLAAIGMLGLFDSSFIRVIQAPEGMFSALALGAFLWCVVLSLIWGTYQHTRNLFRTVIVILGLWLIALIGAGWVAAFYQYSPATPFLRAGFILAAAAGTLVVLANLGYQKFGSRKLIDDTGGVGVNCPRCNYSMRGLSECRCPECGSLYTIDALIRLQDYDAVALQRLAASPDDAPPEKARPGVLSDISPHEPEPGMA